MTAIAYGLRAEYAEAFGGGLVAVTGQQDFNVRDELDAGGGAITVDEDNAALVAALDQYPALKRVPAAKGAKVIGPHDRKTTAQIEAELEYLGLSRGGNRRALVTRLTNARHGVTVEAASPSSGDLGVAGEPAAGGPGEPTEAPHGDPAGDPTTATREA